MAKQDKIKEEILSLIGRGIQFDLDVVLIQITSGNPVFARDKSEELKNKVERLNKLLDELKELTKDDLSSKG